MYDIILFDLDGTVTDPGMGITNSVMYALEKYGIEVKDRSELYKFIGPPLFNSFSDFYGFDDEKANQAVVYYREYYKDKGIYENLVYDGMKELFEELKKKKKIILLATSKPEPFAKQILEHFNLIQYFDLVAGSDFENTRNTKAKVISYALEKYAQQSGRNVETIRQSAVMIGDRYYDVEGANANDIPSIGVLFGYGNRAELQEAGAAYIAETVGDIITYI